MNLKNLSFIFILSFFTGCNHLLYPADRFDYVKPEQIKPKPEDLFIPVDGAPEGSVLHAWCGRDLPSSAASITAQRVGAILPSPHP